MKKHEIETDVNEVDKKLSQAIGGIQKSKEVKENAIKNRFIKHD